MNIEAHLDELLATFRRADQAVMDIYRANSATVTVKADESPVTEADMASHDILTKALADIFPDTPVISEEGDAAQNRALLGSERFWLVDPLDGTKEFLLRNGEFIICAGLIEDGEPVFGVASAPALGVVYYGGPAMGSFKKQGEQAAQQLHVTKEPLGIVLGSRLEMDNATRSFIDKHYPGSKVRPIGSQLKFTQIAEGLADAYPRIGSTMKLWDVAAGHAILMGAGGSVTRPDGSELDYRSANMLAGDFVARAG